ncbi:MAG TPA: hypothetical protein DGB72_11325, partial [Gemmatimonadetes bacterium]|nr:hypothetical protein [Gemmatimonadota bacterium]
MATSRRRSKEPSVGLGNYLKTGLIGAFAMILAGGRFIPGADVHASALFGPATLMAGTRSVVSVDETARKGLLAKSRAALRAFAGAVRPLSHPMALESAFHSYFAFEAAHPDEVRKP